jgi:hypothetical protein
MRSLQEEDQQVESMLTKHYPIVLLNQSLDKVSFFTFPF